MAISVHIEVAVLGNCDNYADLQMQAFNYFMQLLTKITRGVIKKSSDEL